MGVNSTDHNYRRLIQNDLSLVSGLVVGSVLVPEYGFSFNLSAASVDSHIIGPVFHQKPNGDVIAYGASNSGTYIQGVWKSTDAGENWVKQGDLIDSTFTGAVGTVAYNGTTYSAVSGSNILYSSDAINWSIGFTSSSTLKKVIYVEDGPTLGGTNSYFYYLNGSTTLYAQPGEGSMVSSTGQSYTTISSINTVGQGDLGNTDVVWCSGLNLFMRIGNVRNSGHQKIHWSEDGENWYMVSGITGSYKQWCSIEYSESLNRVVVIGIDNNSASYTVYNGVSGDGKTFTLYTTDVVTSSRRMVKWTTKSQEFVIVGAGTGVYTSGTGNDDWVLRESLLFSASPTATQFDVTIQLDY
jgi:hypothetical protein